VLEQSFEYGGFLEDAVLAELEGRPYTPILRRALRRSQESVEEMRDLERTLDEMLALQKKSELHAKFKAALETILKDHPQVERVDVDVVRFAQGGGSQRKDALGPLGKTFDELIGVLKTDLIALRKQTEALNQEFRKVLAATEGGGFARLVLSGRAPFPELVMQNELLIGIYQRLYGKACLTTITATMHSFPAGLEWLPPPTKQ
jgi:hypothetical protein